LFAIGAAGIALALIIGELTKAIGKTQCGHLRIYGIMIGCCGAHDIINPAAWAKSFQNIAHVKPDTAFVLQYFFLYSAF